MFRRWTLTTLAFAAALTSGCGGRLFHRRCDSRVPPRDDRPRDRDLSPGVIQPREFDPIPPSSLPTTPGPAPRLSDPVPPGRRLETFRPPVLQEPTTPYLPPAFVPASPGDLPEPVESKKLVEPQPEEERPKKLYLIPDGVSDSGYSPKTDDGRPRLLDPVGPPADSPNIARSDGPLPTAEPTLPPRTALSSPKPEAPADTRTVTGLQEFTAVKGKDGVTNGRKPSLEGLDWLQKNGYKTVVYLHAVGYDSDPAKRLCERRGMKFVGIPVSADTLKEAATAFDTALADSVARPLYVCDDTGRAAGTLWYAHFRKAELLNPDAAKVRAGGLGLADVDTDAEQKRLWQAAQEYLAGK